MLDKHLLILLQERPRGFVVTSLCRETGYTRHQVRKALRELEKSGFVERRGGRWRIARQQGDETAELGASPAQGEPSGYDVLRRLCLFYADVVQYISGSKLELEHEDDRLSQEITTSVDWHQISRRGTRINRTQLPGRGVKYQKLATFCGPMELMKKRRRGKPSELIWVPVFIVHAKVTRETSALEFFQENEVQINLRWLERHFNAGDEDEKNDLLIRLGFLREQRSGLLEAVTVKDFNKVWDCLQENAPEFRWNETRSLRTPARGGNLAQKTEPGIYSSVLCLPWEKPGYGEGNLIEDLKKIAQATDGQLERTALRHLLGNFVPDVEPAEQVEGNQRCIQASPLNPRQQQAVERALKDPLVVVQGPPGTGKSTVVRNALVSLGVNGNTAIFSSRNNRAVDAVVPSTNIFSAEGKILIDLRPDFDGANWTEHLNENFRVRNVDAVSAHEEKHEKIEVIEDALKESVDELQEIFEAREQLTKINLKAHEFQSEAGDWKDVLDRVVLSRPPQEVRKICDYAILPWFSLNRLRSICVRRKLLREVNAQLTPEMTVTCITLSQISRWKEIEEERSRLERVLQNHSEIPHLNRKIEEAEVELLTVFKELAKELPKEFGARLAAHSVLVSRFRTAYGNQTLNGKLRFDRLCQENFRTVLPGLPLWAITNLRIPRAIPAVAGVFDVAIIDEAAQCDPASILPILYRCKRAMIVGDPMQLPPVKTIGMHKEEHLRRAHGMSDDKFSRLMYSGRSAYDLALDADRAVGGDRLQLTEHYRCHPQIANFFSSQFYDGDLIVRTSFDSRSGADSGIRWTHVPGGSEVHVTSRWWQPQVEAIVGELERLSEVGFDGTVGVVTPFAYHAKRIRDLAHQTLGPRQLQKWEFNSDTADKFQGGEKDLILFGLVGGGDGRTPTPNFYLGPANRFNVAVSRARTLLHVFGDGNWAANCEVPVLNALYKASQIGSQGLPTEIRTDLIGPVWEPLLADVMAREGIEYSQQYPTCGYYLDFATFPDGKKLNIEVDGEKYHRDRYGNLRAEDIRRDLILKADGWFVQRFWVYELREDMKKCIRKIKSLME